MGIQPLGNRVAVKKDAKEESSESGIYLGNDADAPDVGTVVAIGTGKVLEDGSIQPMVIEVGDRVLISTGEEVNVDGETLVIIFEHDIVGKLT